METPPFTRIEPHGSLSPLVVDSPHSGRDYPADFNYACPLPLLRQTEDFKVDELVAGATEAGATLIAATFPRSYIDANRGENDIDPAVLAEKWDAPLELTERTAMGLGLVRRLCLANVNMYAAPLTVKEIRQRIQNYYRPYHAALEAALKRRMPIFGCSYLLNIHSMPSRNQDDVLAERPDIILGDRNGTSCDPSFTRAVGHMLHDMGYSIALNEPYKGMEIVRRHGSPATGRHALQIEINRALYMDERKLELHDGFHTLRDNLTAFFKALAPTLAVEAPEQMAAE